MSNKTKQLALVGIITTLIATASQADVNNAMSTQSQAADNAAKKEKNACSGKNSCAGYADKNHEKCYGIAKKAKNDCAANKHSCAGYAAKDGDPNEWLLVPKGLCEKIVGGHLQPVTTDENKKG